MKILIIGSGAREHAIAEAFHRSENHPHVFISPGNAGIEREFETAELDSFEEIEDFCIIEGISFVFIGPEQPLADGLSDYLRDKGIRVIGPSKAASKIESSKIYAKNLMLANNIPTAKFAALFNHDDALEAVKKTSYPCVIKADGLAAGKGVFIAENQEKAYQVINNLMQMNSLGESGKNIIIEEYLSGWEVSLFAFTDGINYRTTIFAQDHKQLYDGDQGQNTGGMGAYAPVSEAEIYRTEIEKTIIEPLLKAMNNEGNPFEGILYIGLMVTQSGPKVVEFNCRFGDPEAQTILPLLETDFVFICESILQRNMSNVDLKWLNKYSICVYAVGKDYPQGKSVDIPIVYSAHLDSQIFYGGVKKNGNELVTNGGRIMAITSVGFTKAEARTKVYHDMNKFYFEGMHFRTDIGLRENKI